MAFLHPHSCECLKSELELFTIPPTQTSIQSSQWVHYKPISSLNDEAPLEFCVPGHGETYIDLAHTLLSVKVEIQRSVALTDKDNDDSANVGPVNNLLHSMWSQIDVFFNQKPVSPANNLYAYRAYIENLLNYGPSAKASHMSTVLWCDDTAGKMDMTTDENLGLKKRKELVKGGGSIDLIGHLHCDVMNQDRFLINGVELRLRLVRAKDTFCLMDSTGMYKLHILDASLLIRRAKIAPGVLLGHARAIAKTSCKYPLTRVEVKSVILHSGIAGETVDNVILGQLPQRIIIGFTDNKGFNGDRKKNPFNFHHHNINYLSLFVDGVQIPSRPLQPDFTDKKHFVEAYHTLFTGCGTHFWDNGNNIHRTEYAEGRCLFAFDLTADLSANRNTHWNLIKHGTVRIEVGFSTALTSTINCIIYAEYENILEIDSARQITLDYSA